LSKREHALFRLVPKRVGLRWATLVVVLAAIAILAGVPMLTAVVAAVVVFAVGLIPVGGGTLAELAGSRALFEWTAHLRPIHVVPHPAFDVPLDGGGSYGMRWDGRAVLTMLRVEPQSCAVTLLSPGSVTTNDVLPLPEVARCLIQRDLGLTGIDVISSGSRTFGTSPVAQIYDKIIGPLPATAHRTVWLALRMDPRINPDAVRAHGGGSRGLMRAAVGATLAVANRLAAHGVAVSVLSSAELEDAVAQLTENVTPDALTDSWRSAVPAVPLPGADHGGLHLTSFEIDPALLDSQVLTDIWATRSRSTTLTLRMRPVEGGEVAVGAIVRFNTGHRLEPPAVAGLKPLPGRQYRALLACLPIGKQAVRLGHAVCYGPPEALAGIQLPAGGCGQLIGADSSGRAVALPLIGPAVQRVEIVGNLTLAEQVVLRAVAVGAGVVVYTNRPDAWQPIADNIASPQLLSISAPTPDRTVVVSASTTVAVFDGITPPSRVPASTTVFAVRPGEGELMLDNPEAETLMNVRPPADVTLTQHTGATNVVTVRTPGGSTIVRMVAIPQELRYVGDYSPEHAPAPDPTPAPATTP
jgi:type VII secretion protein EccE